MSKIKMVRIDYRMIHGQIVAKWIKFRPVDRLILADDELVDDPFMGDIYKMAVPQKEVDIVKLAGIQAVLDKKDDTVMVIFKNVKSAYTAIKRGLTLPELNVGAVQNAEDRKPVSQGISLSKDEYVMLKELRDSGLNVYLQQIHENDTIDLNSIDKKLS